VIAKNKIEVNGEMQSDVIRVYLNKDKNLKED